MVAAKLAQNVARFDLIVGVAECFAQRLSVEASIGQAAAGFGGNAGLEELVAVVGVGAGSSFGDRAEGQE
ncbi:MAG: hypothetical protein AAF657_22695 [Acidobacteriota bacterium]